MQRFSTHPTIDGYDVIDDDYPQHPVDHRPTLVSANGVAHYLNEAARAGSAVLCGALAKTSGNAPRQPPI